MDTIEGVSVRHIKLLLNDEQYLDKYLDKILFDIYEKPSYKDDMKEITVQLKKLKLTKYDLISHLDSMEI